MAGSSSESFGEQTDRSVHGERNKIESEPASGPIVSRYSNRRAAVDRVSGCEMASRDAFITFTADPEMLEFGKAGIQ